MKKLNSKFEFLRLNFRSRALVLLLVICIPLSYSETAFADETYDAPNLLTSSPLSACTSASYYVGGNSIKFLANSNLLIDKVQINLYRYLISPGAQTIGIYSDLNGGDGDLLGTFDVTTYPAGTSSGLATYVSNSPVRVTSGSYYWLKMNFNGGCVVTSNLTFSGTALTLNLDGNRIIRRFGSTVFTTDWSLNMAIFGGPSTSAPSAPTSVVATATGKRSATVSFGAPSSNNGSAVTSYTATSSPGGITRTLTQATGGTFDFDGLQPNTSYTFAVTATNAIGTSAVATSNSITTTPLVVASLSSLSFVDDGTGTGGKIVWSGKSIDAVLYTGSATYYPGPYNYGAFSSGWNGRIRNLTPGTEYTVSLFVVSADGVGESKSLAFKTSAVLPALPGAVSSTTSQADEMTAQLPKLFAWIDENTFVEGEGDRMKMMLNKFDALVTSPHRSHIKVPTSRVLSVVATSLTPLACSIVSATAKESAGVVKALSGDTCTISYTVSGGSKAPATMIKDFVFKRFG
jgi:hypothetical protein